MCRSWGCGGPVSEAPGPKCRWRQAAVRCEWRGGHHDRWEVHSHRCCVLESQNIMTWNENMLFFNTKTGPHRLYILIVSIDPKWSQVLSINIDKERSGRTKMTCEEDLYIFTLAFSLNTWCRIQTPRSESYKLFTLHVININSLTFNHNAETLTTGQNYTTACLTQF